MGVKGGGRQAEGVAHVSVWGLTGPRDGEMGDATYDEPTEHQQLVCFGLFFFFLSIVICASPASSLTANLLARDPGPITINKL